MQTRNKNKIYERKCSAPHFKKAVKRINQLVAILWSIYTLQPVRFRIHCYLANQEVTDYRRIVSK